MSYKVTPPDLKNSKSYELFKKELDIWEITTPVPEEKRGAVIAALLPNDCKLKKDLKDKFFESVNVQELASKDGLKLVKEFLDEELKEDDLEKQVRTWDEFEDCTRADQDIEDFLSNFDRAYKKAVGASSELTIPAPVRAFMVLKRSNISKTQRMLVMSKLDQSKPDKMFENICRELKIVLGRGPGANSVKDDSSGDIKVFKDMPSEDVLYAAGYVWRGGRGRGSNQGYHRGRGGGKGDRSIKDHSSKPYEKVKKRTNWPREDGKPSTCHHCGSIYHYLNKCPDRNEDVNITETEEAVEKVVLFTEDVRELSEFTREALNCAALDTCCSSSVSGKVWLDTYLESLDEIRRRQVKGPVRSDKLFKFGNNGRLPSQGSYKIPITLANKEVMLEMDVVESDLPLLLSKKAMKTAQMKIDLASDTVTVFGNKEKLITTTGGHYCMYLMNKPDNVENVFTNDVLAVDLLNLSEREQFKAVEKLHKQFGHTPREKFKTFLKEANVWSKKIESHLDNIMKSCEGCIKRLRNPDKPVVSMPMAKSFNEKVAIDLKVWKGKYILHMVDMWSRLTVSCFIDRKKPKEVINKLMEKWIAYYGIMGAVLNDNGGEFTSEEVKEVKDILNVVDLTTGAESPWQNGLCEKNHQIVDTMLERLIEDYPETPTNVLLSWSNMAKNSLQNVYGYSPHQLVFGCNPNLPNIMTNGLPALEGKTQSEIFAMHLNALHASRRAFIQTENCSKIKKALLSRVSTNNTIFTNGDRVWYKRERNGTWKGPAKVIFQDGKVIWVRHGSSAVRVSVNRIVKQGEELYDDSNKTPVEAHDNGAEVAEGTEYKEWGNKIVEIDDTDLDTRETLESYESIDNMLQKIDIDVDESEQLKDNYEGFTDATIITENNKRKRNDIDRDNSVQKRSRIFFPPSKGDKINLKKDDLIQIKLSDESEEIVARVLNRSKVNGKYYNYFNVYGEDGLERNVDLERIAFRKVTEEEANIVTIPKDKQNEDECRRAKETELRKLEDFDSFDVVDDVGQYRISTTWVLWNKGNEVRARLVARGFEETENVPSDSPTVDKCNIRLLLLIASSMGWVIETSDAKSAFLQGKQLERTVIISPPKEANVEKGKLWKLKVALYGLNDASLQFFFKCKDVLLSLGCTQSTFDPAMFIKHDSNGNLIGIIVLHVDDFLHAGNKDFRSKVSRKLENIFTMGKTEQKVFKYVGFDIEQEEEGIRVNMNNYAEEKIDIFDVDPTRALQQEESLTEEEKSQLRKTAGRIGWLGRGARPDLVFAQIEMSTKFLNGKVKDLIRASKLTRKVKSSEANFFIRRLGPVDGWTIEVSTDASLSNLNEGVDSVEARVILIRNEIGDCAPILWCANKIKRIVDSTLEAECLSLLSGLKEAIYLREVIEEIFNLREKEVPVKAIVDNKSTVDAIHSTAPVEDKKLRRDVARIKQMLNTKDVHSVSWCPGKEQLADCLTKRTASSFNLMKVFQSGRR